MVFLEPLALGVDFYSNRRLDSPIGFWFEITWAARALALGLCFGVNFEVVGEGLPILLVVYYLRVLAAVLV